MVEELNENPNEPNSFLPEPSNFDVGFLPIKLPPFIFFTLSFGTLGLFFWDVRTEFARNKPFFAFSFHKRFYC